MPHVVTLRSVLLLCIGFGLLMLIDAGVPHAGIAAALAGCFTHMPGRADA